MITLVHALTRQEQLVSYLNVYLFHESTFPARDSNVKVFRWRYRNKPPLFPHLYFISTAWVPSEPKLRPLASISISIACLVIAKPLHHDTPSFMQISNWLLVKMCSAIIVHQKKKKTLFSRWDQINITWGNKWSSFKVKCGQDHPPALWLYHRSLLWRDLRRDGPDPRMRDMDNHWKHINIWISLSSNHRLYKHKYSGEVKLRSWTSYNTVILSCGSTGNMSLHTAAESLSSYACA